MLAWLIVIGFSSVCVSIKILDACLLTEPIGILMLMMIFIADVNYVLILKTYFGRK